MKCLSRLRHLFHRQGSEMKIREWMGQPILDALNDIKKEIQTMATSVAQFDTLLAQLGTTITGEDATITQALTASDAVIAKLVAAVAATGTASADLTNEAVAVQSMIATATTDTASLSAEVTKLNAQ